MRARPPRQLPAIRRTGAWPGLPQRPRWSSCSVWFSSADGSGVRALLPEVDAGLDGVGVDGFELFGAELQVADRGQVVLELGDAGGADQRAGDAVVAQCPREGELRDSLSALLGDLVQRANVLQRVLGQAVRV